MNLPMNFNQVNMNLNPTVRWFITWFKLHAESIYLCLFHSYPYSLYAYEELCIYVHDVYVCSVASLNNIVTSCCHSSCTVQYTYSIAVQQGEIKICFHNYFIMLSNISFKGNIITFVQGYHLITI